MASFEIKDYDTLHRVLIAPPHGAKVEDLTAQREALRRQYIQEHSMGEYTQLLMMVLRDASDIRNMDQRLAEVVYDR